MSTAIASSLKHIKLAKIAANSGQTRGMGVMPQLKEMGYGVFEKASSDADKFAIWPALTGDKPEMRKKAAALIREHEPEVVEAAESQDQYGQLQPIRVVPLADGEFDIVFGMTRALAVALNAAESAKAPDTIEAMVMEKAPKDLELRFMGFEENNNRRPESPIDQAIFFHQMKDEYKLSPADIGKRIGRSDQHVRNHIKLLSKSLADKRMDIHTGKLSVDKALKLLAKRKEGEEGEEGNGKPGGKARARMHSVKKLDSAYTAKKKPEWMEQKEWEMFVKPDVRQWLAYLLGKKFKEFTGELVSEETDTDAAEGKKKGLKLTIPRKLAVRLLTALALPESEQWPDEEIAKKLENIVNIAEADTTLDDEKLQSLLDKLMKNYESGITITIKTAK